MKILLVYPRYPDTFWSFKHILKFISKKSSMPPLGLLTVASMLPEEWEKKLIDINVNELKDEDIKWADMIFISAMLVQKENTQEIINKCKQFSKTVVAGGPAFTTKHDSFRKVDHFVLNEAEITLPMFLDDLKKEKAKKIYTSAERPDITKTPVPMWSLVNFKDYATMPVQYSRGCPFNCEFCDIIIMNGRTPRVKSNEQMLNEFQALYNAGWRNSVFIVDDNFIGNKTKVKKLLPYLINWQKKHRYPFAFLTEASINLAEDNELLEMMSAANFNKVFLGIETPNIDSLKECNKTHNTRIDLVEAVKKIHQHGMQVLGGFIVGFDNDKNSIFETQIKFIQQVGIVTAMVGMLDVLPQTRLWHRLKAGNRLLKDSTGENTDGNLNFIPKMGRKKLIAGYKKILSTIYSPGEYYKRINTLIKNLRPTVKTRFSFENLGALFKSMWSVGILSRTRFLYWKAIIKTFFTNIKAFPVVVELAIYWLHFEKITKRVVNSA